MRPGITRNANVADTWGRLATLYDAGYTDKMVEGQEVAHGFYLSIASFAAQIVFSDTTPTGQGHLLDTGSAFLGQGQDWIKRAWIKNNVAASIAVAVITPIFNL